jgi:hypothetical protein
MKKMFYWRGRWPPVREGLRRLAYEAENFAEKRSIGA